LGWFGGGLAGFIPGSNPPDTNGRVGAKQYVQWNNTSFAVFNKTTGALLYGRQLATRSFNRSAGVRTHNDGDIPWSRSTSWPGAGSFTIRCWGEPRFFASVRGRLTNRGRHWSVLPLRFRNRPHELCDYPKIGVWPDGYYMSGHVFNASGTAYLAGRIFVLNATKCWQAFQPDNFRLT